MTITSTSTEIDVITSTMTVTLPTTTLTFKALIRRGTTVAKRQATSVPSSIPGYASACSGSVRYSSACSCVGATKATITAVTPSTTIFVTQVSLLFLYYFLGNHRNNNRDIRLHNHRQITTQTTTYLTTSTSTQVLTDLITSTTILYQTVTSIATAFSTVSPDIYCNVNAYALTNNIVGAFAGTKTSCQEQCLAVPDCESFYYFEGACGYFSVPASEVALIDSATQQVFFDRNCPISVTTTAP